MTVRWDKRLSVLLKEKGYNHDQVMEIIGIIAEERQQSDLEGYKRGYNNGHTAGIKMIEDIWES
jgi:hypothetical protein